MVGSISGACCQPIRSKALERFVDEVERMSCVGVHPLGLSPEQEIVLTPHGEPIQFKELAILKAELFHKFGVNILLDRAAIRTTTDRDALDSRRPLEHT